MSANTNALGKIEVKNRTGRTSPRTYARIVGILYLVIFILGPFAFFMGRTSVVVPGDPAATISNLMASEAMFRFGMVAETVIILIEIVVSAMLYVLLKPVSRPVKPGMSSNRKRCKVALFSRSSRMRSLTFWGGSSCRRWRVWRT